MDVAVLGYGTIGSGVVEVLKINQDVIEKKAGCPLRVKYVLDLRDFPGDPVQRKLVKDFQVIVQDPDVKIVAEAMGGLHPAYEFVRASLEAGKSVATSNKELVAAYGAQLLKIAEAHHVNFFFEASVGGGIPVIRTMNMSLTPEYFIEVMGILNGTTNYILTQMEEAGATFEEALKQAQEKGYAERNPQADVEGYDACRKIAILSSLAFGKTVDYEQIPTEGITEITLDDLKVAKALGRKIKLIARSYQADGKVFAKVSPLLLKLSHPLASISGVYNGVLIRGNMVDDIVLQGTGAGKKATASAVVADIMTAARYFPHQISARCHWEEEVLTLTDSRLMAAAYMIRTDCPVAASTPYFAQTVPVSGVHAFTTGLVNEQQLSEVRAALTEAGCGILGMIQMN